MSYLIVENRTVGFFSGFNLIAGSLNHIRENNIEKFYVVWQNPLYQEQNYNLFDKYFFQQQPVQEFTERKTAFDLGIDIVRETEIRAEKEKEKLYSVPYQKLNKTLKYFNYFENAVYKSCKQSCVFRTKSLGVHVRQTDHGYHGKLLTIEEYFNETDRKLENYENIFVATDENRIIQKFVERYGNRVFFNEDIIRSDNSDPVHLGKYLQYREKLAGDVIKDAISLSMCDEIIMTSSNIAHYVFMLNPELKYSKIDWHIEHIN
jgi:hypothetical protein